ncbi:hypothetical protein BA062_37510 [Prauserella flavalba]|uniref:Uncharacterized protein n=1 Tax=Prauserella flavalba TaxID=1477506 RepID=A0A318L8Z7_9PSEU|nr:hypothetical protein BA062_37510 [Prauserella flavalba]
MWQMLTASIGSTDLPVSFRCGVIALRLPQRKSIPSVKWVLGSLISAVGGGGVLVHGRPPKETQLAWLI